MRTFKDVYNFATSKKPNIIISIVDEKEFNGLNDYQRANKIREGYHFAVAQTRGKMVFRVLFKEQDMLNITFKFSAPNQVEIYDFDDFGSSKLSQVYTLPIEANIKEAFKLPIIRKQSIKVLLDHQE